MRLKEHGGLVVNEEFLEVLTSNGLDSFGVLMGYAGGESVKVKKERSVVRLELGHGDGKKAFYLKRHFNESGATPRGGIRSILSWKGPEDARNEWEKTILLTELNIPTMTPVAFGEAGAGVGTGGEEGGKAGASGALTLTEGLEGVVKFDDYLPELAFERAGMEGVRKKRALIGELARLARRFHDGGLNHQDFYLVHFLIRPGSGELYLADLQRVQRRSVSQTERVSVSRWVVKDLGQFAFSALAASNFTHADLMRFAHAYLGRGTLDREDKKLIKRVLSKARRIATHDAKLRERARGETA